MGLKVKEKYEQRKIDRLFDHLKVYHDKGTPIDFEIIVDDFKVVRRTHDLDMFTMFENYVDANTKNIEFLLYAGVSNSNDKHMFSFGNAPQESLDGIDVQEKINSGVDQKMREQEFEKLKEDNKELKEEVEDLEKEVTRLEKQNDELQAGKSPLNSVLGDFGATLVERFIKRNPKVMSSIPGGEALAGLLDSETSVSNEPAEDAEISFKSKNDTTTSELSEDDQNAIEFANQIRTQFSKIEFGQIAMIVQTIVDREKFEQVLNLLNINFNQQ